MNYAQAAKVVTSLKMTYFSNDETAQVEDMFNRRLALRRANLDAGRVHEAHGFTVIGESGSGKSTTFHRMFSDHPQITYYVGEPGPFDVASSIVKKPATLKEVGRRVLMELGYPIKSERSSAYFWELVRHQLKERRALFLHLDEAQHLYDKDRPRETLAVLDTLKSMMISKDWPIGIILSGTGELSHLLNADSQLVRRVKPIYYPSLVPQKAERAVLEIVRQLSADAQLHPHPDLSQAIFARRLCHAACDQFGLTIEMTIEAIFEALITEKTKLTETQFKEAFRQRTACFDGANPFVVEDFEAIDCRRVLEMTYGRETGENRA